MVVIEYMQQEGIASSLIQHTKSVKKTIDTLRIFIAAVNKGPENLCVIPQFFQNAFLRIAAVLEQFYEAL